MNKMGGTEQGRAAAKAATISKGMIVLPTHAKTFPWERKVEHVQAAIEAIEKAYGVSITVDLYDSGHLMLVESRSSNRSLL